MRLRHFGWGNKMDYCFKLDYMKELKLLKIICFF